MKPSTKRKQRRASIADLERVHQTDFRVRAPGPRLAGRKPRQGMRARSTVPADERAIRALKPDGTNQQFKVAGIPHLFVRIGRGGKRTFYVIRHVNGQRAGRTLGEVGVMSLREAALGCQVAVLKWRVAELEAELQAGAGD